MSILSTAQAVQLGIESISAREDIPKKTKAQAIRLLQSLEQADWHRNWTQETVIQALKDYKERTGVAPTSTSLKEHGMPKGVTIQSLFHMTPSHFLKQLFPETRSLQGVDAQVHNAYGFETEQDWLNCFAEQFNRHKHEEMCCKKYNIVKDKHTPTWETIARHCHVTTWRALMEKAGVRYDKKTYQTASELRVTGFKSPLVEKLDAINKERARLNKELADLFELHDKRDRQRTLEQLNCSSAAHSSRCLFDKRDES